MRIDWDVPIAMDDGLVQRAEVLRPQAAIRSSWPAVRTPRASPRRHLWRHHGAVPAQLLRPHTGESMKLYGFWRSLATYRVNVAFALKNIRVEENVSIDLLKGEQLNADYRT